MFFDALLVNDQIVGVSFRGDWVVYLNYTSGFWGHLDFVVSYHDSYYNHADEEHELEDGTFFVRLEDSQKGFGLTIVFRDLI